MQIHNTFYSFFFQFQPLLKLSQSNVSNLTFFLPPTELNGMTTFFFLRHNIRRHVIHFWKIVSARRPLLSPKILLLLLLISVGGHRTQSEMYDYELHYVLREFPGQLDATFYNRWQNSTNITTFYELFCTPKKQTPRNICKQMMKIVITYLSFVQRIL